MLLLSLKKPLLIGAAFTLAACANGTSPPPTGAVDLESRDQREAQFVLLANTCPVSEPLTPPTDGLEAQALPGAVVLTVLAPVLIDYAVSGVRDYLERVESERTGSFMATGAGTVTDGTCLVIGRGMVGTTDITIPSQRQLDDPNDEGLGADFYSILLSRDQVKGEHQPRSGQQVH